jgi:hypothetical protein
LAANLSVFKRPLTATLSPRAGRGRSDVSLAALLVARPGHLPAAARLARSVSAASHEEPRSFLSFAQYSSRFLISRSKPRSGGL